MFTRVQGLLGLSALALSALPFGCSRFTSCEDTLSCSGGGSGGDSSGGSSSGGSSLGGGGSSSGGDGTGGKVDPCDACKGDTPFCNADKECVACLENADCKDASASLCDASGSCSPCAKSDDCKHLTETKVCDTDASECVECLDSADCGGNPCNPVTHKCSEFGTDRRTCESCDTDANCNTADNYCVPMKYDGTDRPGGYCLKKTPGCAQPFATLISSRTSLSGVVSQNYCGINEGIATCEAVRALADNVSCSGGTDAECPESGVCRDIGGTLTDRCTFRCVTAADCTQSGAGSTCGDSPNDFCGYVP